MALCCLLIETLQGFRQTAECKKKSKTASLFKKFLRRPAFRGAFDDEGIASAFVEGIRHGILHDAETRKWVIWRNEPKGRILGSYGNRYVVNRTEFYTSLKQEVEAYLEDLRDASNASLRARFLEKMGCIVERC